MSFNKRTITGEPLKAGYNVDPVCVKSGLEELENCGYDHPNTKMLIEYCLIRYSKGEEELAEKTAIAEDLNGVSFTCWRRILATAIVAAKNKNTKE